MKYVAVSLVTDRQTHRMTTVTLVPAPRINEVHRIFNVIHRKLANQVTTHSIVNEKPVG